MGIILRITFAFLFLVALLHAIFVTRVQMHLRSAVNCPKQSEIKFFDRYGKIFFIFHKEQKFCEPLPSHFPTEIHLEQIRLFFDKKYVGSKGRFSFLVANRAKWYLARELSKKGSVPVMDALFLYHTTSLTDLVKSVWSSRKISYGIFGLSLAAKIQYEKPLQSLSTEEFQDVLHLLYNANGQNSGFRKRSLEYLKRQSFQNSNEALSYINFCMDELSKKGFDVNRMRGSVFTHYSPYSQRILYEKSQKYFIDLQGHDAHRTEKLRELPPIESASIFIDTKSGGIMALLGGKSPASIQEFNRVYQSKRQISSTIKPFLYATALEDGRFHAASLFVDKPLVLHDSKGTIWKPENFYPYYLGEMTLKRGLVVSVNTLAVQLMEALGRVHYANKIKKVFFLPGNQIAERVLEEPSLALGSLDLSLYELAKGYTMLANNGVEIVPSAVTMVQDETGYILWKKKSNRAERLFSRESVAIITEMLEDVIRNGTAAKFSGDGFPFAVAGKSGSSPADSWFAGYNPSYLLVAWAGYDYPELSLQGHIPLFTVIPFWMDVMSTHKPIEQNFTIPIGLERLSFCEQGGCLTKKKCEMMQGLFSSGHIFPECP